MRGLHALGSDARGHTQLFKTQGAVAAAVNVDFLVIRRFEAKRAKGQMLEGFQESRAVLEKQFFVTAIEIGKHFGIRRSCRFTG